MTEIAKELLKFRELRLGENITGCTANHNSWAGHGSSIAPAGTGLGNASVLTYPLSQGWHPRGSRLRSLPWALLQRAALIIHPVALELAQQVKEAFLVRRGPVDFLGRERRVRTALTSP